MDSSSSSSSQNWLGFSLSNHPHQHSSSLSLFHAFTSPTQGPLSLSLSLSLELSTAGIALLHISMRNLYNFYLLLGITGTGVDEALEKDAAAGATDLSMFTAGPKLEDFLGGSTATTGAAPLPQFSNETPP
jgi:AP2-like factor (ANT lineage)